MRRLSGDAPTLDVPELRIAIRIRGPLQGRFEIGEVTENAVGRSNIRIFAPCACASSHLHSLSYSQGIVVVAYGDFVAKNIRLCL